MDLSDLNTYLHNLISDGVLTLSANDNSLPTELQTFLLSAPKTTIIIEQSGQDLIVLDQTSLCIQGSSQDSWPIYGMIETVVNVSSVNIVLGADDSIILSATAELALDDDTGSMLAITSDNQSLGVWCAQLTQALEDVSVEQLLCLGLNGPSVINVPTTTLFENTVSVEKNDLSICFYPHRHPDYQYDVRTTSASNWTLITDVLTFEKPEIVLNYLGLNLSCIVGTQIDIDNTPVQLNVSLSTGNNCRITMLPVNSDTFPSLTDLAQWILGESSSEQITNGFTEMQLDLGGFNAGISAVMLSFNWSSCAFNRMQVNSILTIAETEFDVSFSLPDMIALGQLNPETPIDLGVIFENFGFDATNIPSLVVTGFTVSADIAHQTYGLSATIEEDWNIGPLVLEQTSFYVAYNQSEGITGSFTASIQLGDAQLFVSAGYAGEDVGWFFEGGTEADTQLSIGSTLEAISAAFGIDIPAPIASLELNNILISYETGTGNFTFTLEGDFIAYDTPVAMIPFIKIESNNDGDTEDSISYSAEFGGSIQIGELVFSLVFDIETEADSGGSSEFFIASYSHTSDKKAANLHDLVDSLAPSLSELVPESLVIDLMDVFFTWSDTSKSPTDVTVEPTVEPTSKFSLGFDLCATFDLGDIPLVGVVFPEGETVGFNDLKIVYSSAVYTPEECATLNDLLSIPAGGTDTIMTVLPASGCHSGVNVNADMVFGSLSEPLSLDLTGTAGSLPQSNYITEDGTPAIQPSSGFSNGLWFNLQKAFGPMYFSRVGVNYFNGALFFMLDASLEVDGLEITLEGAGFGTPLNEFDLRFTINGVGIEYKVPGFEVGGGLMVLTPPPLGTEFQFDGDAVLQVGPFSLAGIGSYAQLDSGEPSLFVYAHMNFPLGPIPAFFIHGLGAGFGYNRQVIIPEQNEVLSFPLIAVSSATDAGAPDMETILAIMEGRVADASGNTKVWLSPNVGEYWAAFGLDWSSYEVIQSQGMMVAKFGNEFELALLGVAMMRLPQIGGKAFAYIEMDLIADFKPADGFIGLSAALSNNSFLLDKNCHISGGFAFYVWWSGQHRGQFVCTLGGYHPQFQRPDFYPQEARVGINWAASDLINIKGNGYFALTPSAVMAGGELQVVFHEGDLKAWFTANADMLIALKPFYFSVDTDVSVGASYTMDMGFCTETMSVEMGCTFHFHYSDDVGVGGSVYVDWFVISFTISFGADKHTTEVKPLTWDEFKTLLPDQEGINTLIVNNGLNSQLSDGRWMVRADQFQFTSNSQIPASALYYGTQENNFLSQEFVPQIRQMNIDSFVSTQTLSIKEGDTLLDVSDWELIPVLQNMPDSLWGAPLVDQSGLFIINPQTPSSGTVNNAPIGISVTPPPASVGYSCGAIELKVLAHQPVNPDGVMPLVTEELNSLFVPHQSTQSLPDIALTNSAKQMSARDSLFTILSEATGDCFNNGLERNDPMANMAENSDHLFSNSPMSV